MADSAAVENHALSFERFQQIVPADVVERSLNVLEELERSDLMAVFEEDIAKLR